MSDEYTKASRSQKRKRNIMAKHLHDSGDHKGAFSMKVEDARKGVYKREHLRVTEIDNYFEEDDE